MKLSNPMKRKPKAKVTTAKPPAKKAKVEAPTKKSVEKQIVADYQTGTNYNELAEKYGKTVEAVAKIVGA